LQRSQLTITEAQLASPASSTIADSGITTALFTFVPATVTLKNLLFLLISFFLTFLMCASSVIQAFGNFIKRST